MTYLVYLLSNIGKLYLGLDMGRDKTFCGIGDRRYYCLFSIPCRDYSFETSFPAFFLAFITWLFFDNWWTGAGLGINSIYYLQNLHKRLELVFPFGYRA